MLYIAYFLRAYFLRGAGPFLMTEMDLVVRIGDFVSYRVSHKRFLYLIFSLWHKDFLSFERVSYCVS